MLMLAAGSAWSWLIPCLLALLALYGQLLTRAYLGTPITEWLLIGTVIGFILGWPARVAVLTVFSRWLGAAPNLGRLALLYLWAALPLTVRDLLQISYMLRSGSLPGQPGLAGLLEPHNSRAISPMLELGLQLLAYVDLFTLWHLALLVIMLQIGARASLRQALLVTAAYGGLLLLLRSSTLLLMWF